MATREIKTTISLDGEQKFKHSLSAAAREMRVMESELRAVSAAYDENGDAAQFFAAKQQNLRNQISQQREIISALERAVEDSTKRWGDGSHQVDAYAIRLNNARTRMSRLQKELDATDREVEELGRDSVRAGRQLEQGIGDGAEAAENSVKSLLQTMQQDIHSINVSSTISAVTGLWDMATGAYSAVTGFVDQTAEYRQKLSFLEQNAATRGFDFEGLKDDLVEVQGITRDASSAIETLSNLLAADPNEWQLEKAIDNLAGAVISFPDTLKFESLADGLQETIATGSATGQFGELLERLGVDVEAFNLALEESETQSGDLEIALAYLAAHGMADVYKQWRENNQAIADAQKTQAALEAELARFGGKLEQYIVTPVKSLLVEALDWVNDTIEIAETEGADAAFENLESDAALAITKAVSILIDKTNTAKEQMIDNAAKGISNITKLPEETSRQWAINAVDSFMTAISPQYGYKRLLQELGFGDSDNQKEQKKYTEVAIGEARDAIGFDFVGPLTESQQALVETVAAAIEEDRRTGEMLGKLYGMFAKAGISANAAKDLTGMNAVDRNTLISTIIGYKTWDIADRAMEKMTSAGEDIRSALTNWAEKWEAPKVTDLVRMYHDETDGATWNPNAIITSGTGEIIQPMGIQRDMDKLFKDLGITIRESESDMEEAGEGVGAAVSSGFESGVSSLPSIAYQNGAQAAAQMAAGLLSRVGYVASAGASLGSAAAAGMGSIGTGRGSGNGVLGTAAGVINAVMNIDGRTFAQAVAPFMSSAMAVQIS